MNTQEPKKSTEEMAMPESSCSAKYIFMDIVGFSRERYLEAQSTIIKELNRIVLESIKKHGISFLEECIFIPTGDGICVALINHESYDIHMRIALEVLALLDEYNSRTNDEIYKFQVRIGINSNEDNLINDINGRTNLAGAGITLAQRIMDKADGNQILVGQSARDSLGQHKQYWKLFKEYQTEDKHGNQFLIHQYQGNEHVGLNIETPRSVDKKSSEQINKEVKLSDNAIVAWYLAHAIREEALLKANQNTSYSGMVFLWFLALDSVGESGLNEYEAYAPKIIETSAKTSHAQLNGYSGVNVHLTMQLALYIRDVELKGYREYFVRGQNPAALLFINSLGKEKLKQQCPEIWEACAFS